MDRGEIIRKLGSRGAAQEALWQRARAVRAEHVGRSVTLRGIVEISNVCRVNCLFCGMRRDNGGLSRFVLGVDEIVGAAERMEADGIRTIFLQAGEFPGSTDLVVQALEAIFKRTSMGAILCLGNKTQEEFRRLRDAGADRYILKQETSDPVLYERLKEESLGERLQCIEWLLDLGFRIGVGNVVGLPGQTLESLADDVMLAKRYGAHMASASPFIPNDQTPLMEAEPGDTLLTLNVLAVMRLLRPDAQIPSVSALESAREDGQYLGLMAGGNVLTVNYTPELQRSKYLLYKSDRYVVGLDHARRVVSRANLVTDCHVPS